MVGNYIGFNRIWRILRILRCMLLGEQAFKKKKRVLQNVEVGRDA